MKKSPFYFEYSVGGWCHIGTFRKDYYSHNIFLRDMTAAWITPKFVSDLVT